jgi:prephenate dehydrogenase
MKGTPDSIAVIGGEGKMGRWFIRFFEEMGLSVVSAGRNTSVTPEEAAKDAEVVVLSVPMGAVKKTAKELGPLVREKGLLTDITSLKREAMESMLAHSKCEVVGTHPLFGPGEPGMVGQTVVICPGRGEGWQGWLEGLFRDAGAHVVTTTPEEHDTLMTVVQGLNHILNLAIGLTVMELGVEPGKLRKFSTPSFGTRLRQIEHLLFQDPDLYAELNMLNPEFPRTFRAFGETCRKLMLLIEKEDKGEFARLFREALKFFNDRSAL